MKVRAGRNERAAALQGSRAGLVSRVLAGLIDLAVVAIVGVLLLLFAAVARSLVLGAPFDLASLPRALMSPAAFLAEVVYLSYFWSTTGRTPGNQVLGLRVVDLAGRRLRLRWAVLRAVLCLVFPVGLLWVLVSRHNASLQDLLVRTAVVYDWAYRTEAGPSMERPLQE